MDRWRFIDDRPATGAENMARDELLLERIEREGGSPILRLYSFDPSAITIGAHQDAASVLDLDAVHAGATDVVRRPTGGRALLHEGELTYCVAGPKGALGEGLMGTYLRISEALAAALRSVGVAGARVERGFRAAAPGSAASPCLASTARHELAVGGRKIAGSAERMTRTAFLQHGSILLTTASGRITRYLRPAAAPGAEALRITSVSDELGAIADAEALRAALCDAFAELFGTPGEPFAFSPAEEEEIRARTRVKASESLEIMARWVSPRRGMGALGRLSRRGDTAGAAPKRREVAT
jgi:lipoate-protein ligase A